jgi:hypothetical protein
MSIPSDVFEALDSLTNLESKMRSEVFGYAIPNVGAEVFAGWHLYDRAFNLMCGLRLKFRVQERGKNRLITRAFQESECV